MTAQLREDAPIQVIREILALPATFAICAASGALNAPPRSRRALCVAVATLTLLAPWLPSPEAPIVRFSCAGGTALAVFRNLDLYRDRRTWSICQRAIHLIGVFDSRRVKYCPAHFARSSWSRAGLFGAATAMTGWVLVHVGAPSGVMDYALRWACGAVWTYASIEMLTAISRATCAVLGVELPRLHDDPILSRTLSEFWGRRWNLSVHCMLHDHCFRPLAQRRSFYGGDGNIRGQRTAALLVDARSRWPVAGPEHGEFLSDSGSTGHR